MAAGETQHTCVGGMWSVHSISSSSLAWGIGLFFFEHKQGPGVLVQTGSSTGGLVNITTIGLRRRLVPLAWIGIGRSAIVMLYTYVGDHGTGRLAMLWVNTPITF